MPPDSDPTESMPDWAWTLIVVPMLGAVWVAVPAFLLTFVVGLVVWAIRRRADRRDGVAAQP